MNLVYNTELEYVDSYTIPVPWHFLLVGDTVNYNDCDLELETWDDDYLVFWNQTEKREERIKISPDLLFDQVWDTYEPQ